MAAILALSLFLNLRGIGWGVPTAQHVRSYHPDEWTVIEAAERVDLLHGQINPGFYNYSSLYIYSLWAALVAAQSTGFVSDAHPTGFNPENDAHIHLVCRFVTALYSAGTVLLTFWLGQRLFGGLCGGGASLLLALCPLFVVHSHYAAVDVPAAFWMVAAALAASFSLPSKEVENEHLNEVDKEHLNEVDKEQLLEAAPVSRRVVRTPAAALFSAALAGLAAGTKYNAGAVIGVALLAWYWRWRDHAGPRRTPHLIFGWVILLIAAVVAFLISTPAVLTDTDELVKAFLYEVQHSRTGHEYVFAYTLPALLHHLRYSLFMGMGPPLLALSLWGALVGLLRRRPADLLLAAAVVPYFLVIGTAQIKFMRYVIPLLPFLCIWASRAALEPRRRLAGTSSARVDEAPLGKRFSSLPMLFFASALCFAAVETWAFDGVFVRPDVRDQAEAWIVHNVRAGSSIGLPGSPWFDTPPLIADNTHLPAQTIENREQEWAYRIVITGWNAETLERQLPEYFLYSEWQVRYLERIHRLDPHGSSDAAGAARSAAALLAALSRYYSPAADFKNEPVALGINWRMGFVPDDWLYPFPEIRLFRLRRPAPALLKPSG